MHTPAVWAWALVILGLAAMLGAIDPLEGSFVILLGAALVAGGAGLARSRHRGLLLVSLVLVAVGVAAMMALSWFGGVGGDSGHSMWWLLIVIPYPIRWILGLIGAVLVLVELFKHHAPPAQAVP